MNYIINDYDRGEFYANLRKEQSLTQSQLANMLDVSDKAVSKWETGKCLPETSTLLKLSKLYGMTIDELIAGKRSKNVNELHESAMLGLYNKVPKRKVSVLQNVFVSVGLMISASLSMFLMAFFSFSDEIVSSKWACVLIAIFFFVCNYVAVSYVAYANSENVVCEPSDRKKKTINIIKVLLVPIVSVILLTFAIIYVIKSNMPAIGSILVSIWSLSLIPSLAFSIWQMYETVKRDEFYKYDFVAIAGVLFLLLAVSSVCLAPIFAVLYILKILKSKNAKLMK